MKKGDVISVMIDGTKVEGTIRVLTPNRLSVCIVSPFESCASVFYTKQMVVPMGDLAFLKGEEFITTELGERTAYERLTKLATEVLFLTSHQKEVSKLIVKYNMIRGDIFEAMDKEPNHRTPEYRRLRKLFTQKLPMYVSGYFPNLNIIQIDEDFMYEYSERILHEPFEKTTRIL